jgi:ParB-like nuclease family protein
LTERIDWAAIPASGKASEFPLSELHLDLLNPRLPEKVTFKDEDDLLRFVANAYNTIVVAESIADHGFFVSEPLIVTGEDGRVVVMEGNRRLAALKILEDPNKARDLDDEKRFRAAARVASLPNKVPVVLSPSRLAVASLVGYRHISGIEPWEPYPQARFIAHQIDGEQKLSFQQVAENIGERPTDVAAKYRNYCILKQAEEVFGLDTTRAVRSFGVFTRAMVSPHLRAFIGAPQSSGVIPREKPLAGDRGANVRLLLQWLFGSEAAPKVIAESRDITALGRVVASESGLDELIRTNSLAAGEQAAGGYRDRLLQRLESARASLESALQDIEKYRDEERVQELLEECWHLLLLLNPQNAPPRPTDGHEAQEPNARSGSV